MDVSCQPQSSWTRQFVAQLTNPKSAVATLIKNRDDVLRTKRTIGPRNLVFVPTEVTPLIALIVNLVIAIQVRHVKLRREFERAFPTYFSGTRRSKRTISD